MVVSVLRIEVACGAEEELVRAFVNLRVFEHSRRSGGFRVGRLLRPVAAAGEPFLVVAEWDGPEAYRRWLENPARDELRERLSPLIAGELMGIVYEEAITLDVLAGGDHAPRNNSPA